VKLLLDTHIWIWMLTDTPRLAPKLVKALHSQENELWLSPISIWELFILVEKRRLGLNLDTAEWIAQAAKVAPFREAPLTAEVVLATRQIRLPHRDPADMFLAATAKVFDLTLVTSDAHLRAVKEISLLHA
jgi:PIN domain nuclease of toxin-antitoxin system